MSQTEMEKRLASLEREVTLLKAEVNAKLRNLDARATGESKRRPWWHDHVGTFAGDPAHEEAMRLGREWRDEQNEIDRTD